MGKKVEKPVTVSLTEIYAGELKKTPIMTNLALDQHVAMEALSWHMGYTDPKRMGAVKEIVLMRMAIKEFFEGDPEKLFEIMEAWGTGE
jgi:hypothetical protein